MKTAYPQFQGTVQIRLYSNIPFDNSYQHHSLIDANFKDDDENIYTGNASLGPAKERFINRTTTATGNPYYYPRYEISGEFNFDYSNGLLASVILDLTPEQTNANYMRVYSHNTNGGEYYYYFITGYQQVNTDTYRLSLELDVLMTYQYEFLTGILAKPVFTSRKHCHRFNSNNYPKCVDFKSGEDAFAGIKPSIIKSKKQLSFSNTNLSKLEGSLWCYICIDTLENPKVAHSYLPYSFDGCKHPLTMICFPLKLPSGIGEIKMYHSLTISSDFLYADFTSTTIDNLISSLVGDGSIHGCKILPYPPFADDSAVITTSGSIMTISFPISHSIGSISTGVWWNNDKTLLFAVDAKDYLVITLEKPYKYNFNDVELDDFLYDDFTIQSNRILDPKLLFSPFRKYVLSSAYSTGEEIFPELAYSDGCFFDANLSFYSYITTYIGDNNISTYLYEKEDENDFTFFSNYLYGSVGLVSNVNYIIPAGTNALDVFNATQAQSFYTSKVASGITSGITMAGGVASIGMGIAGIAGGYFTGGSSAIMGAGLIAGGASAIASGTAGVATTIKSTEAKIEDLRNTPDSYNVLGSSFTSDYGRIGNILPYLLIYECTASTKEKANDYFYNYGYAVSRDCYFNRDLEYDNDDTHKCDNNLFTRRIFNYIKLDEDITNKINYDMPLIIKQKLSQIFNKGITLWSFFGNPSLWGNSQPTGTTNPDIWFMKHDKENAEWDY